MRNDVEMPFGDHLDELRRRVIYAVVGLVVAAIICGVNYEFLLSSLMRPYKKAYEDMIAAKLDAEEDEQQEKIPPLAPEPEGIGVPEDSPLAPVLTRIEKRLLDIERRLDAIAPEKKAGPEAEKEDVAYANRFPAPRVIQGGPLTGYVTAILLCVICGIILGSPWILYQIWAFVGVGLYAHERRFVYFYGPFSFLLFVGGAATFYFIMLPVALGALMAPTAGIMVDGMPIIDPSFFLNDYFKFVAMMTLIFGVVFQTPLVVMFIAWTEIVPLGTLFKKQKIVLMVLIVASAVLTPQDPVTMALMAIPLILLYQFGLLLAWITLRKKRKRRAEEGEDEDDWWGGDDEGGSLPAAPTGEGPAPADDAGATPGDDEDALTPGDDESRSEESTETEESPETSPEDESYPEDDLYEYEREYGQYSDEDLYGYGDEDYDEPDESDMPFDDETPFEEESPDESAPRDAGDDEAIKSGDDESRSEESPGTEEPPRTHEGEAEESPGEEESPGTPHDDADAGLPPEDRMK
jgi:sec-independent protein translocase protein TatC